MIAKQLIEMIEGSERHIIGERPMKELNKLFPYFTKQNKKKKKETKNHHGKMLDDMQLSQVKQFQQ